MQFNNVRKNLLMSIVVFIIMILLLILLSGGNSSAIKTVSIIILLATSVIIVGIIWATYYQIMKEAGLSVKEDIQSEVNEVLVHTGTVCDISGLYQCVEHDYRKINMKKGRRFPPCKGEDKGHSTDWKLIKKVIK